MSEKKFINLIKTISVEHWNFGLERVKNALEILELNRLPYKIILVGGTNGKGSTVKFIQHILVEHGIRTGLFTSPHLIEYNERFNINLDNLPYYVLIEGLSEIKDKIKGLNLTEFEVLTILSLYLFKKLSVDVCILEVGLGGRLDATNAIEPDISVLTRIDVDHKNFLGNTIEEIVKEKTKISRKDKRLVIAKQTNETLNIILEDIDLIGSNPILSDDEVKTEFKFNKVKFIFNEFETDYITPSLTADYQIENMKTALVTSYIFLRDFLNVRFEHQKFQRAIEKTKWPGRFQVIKENPLLLLDGSHNPSGFKALSQSLEKILKYEKAVFIIGILKDKDAENMIDKIILFSKEIIFTQVPSNRTMTLGDYKKVFSNLNFTYMDIEKAKTFILKRYPFENIVVCGSLYLIGEILKTLKQNKDFQLLA
ncbi:dihydrofolate synthase / folylpolyglutamate synthase [Thermodesulfobium acidiphilum]|uniref:Dihydrofolate synthase/folylpolyglutamate synthase n=1 Tax=Thermodesulfobium acidiphilum TaxID=1794699 RepID=A0A2R4W1G4_THEAF|nr:folylpolyglutamate synthase/dihydrofolate synthase family protein [Thermodesulfobium acidiphilum]AWB10653.1 dihydrofolate synthase / folylpolyglutamate synthase [Thermodesulfobium acidiphilum]